MTSLAQQLSEIADKKNAEKAEKEVSEMYDYIVARAQNVARTTFKWFTIKMFDMHKELGYVDFLKEREYYHAEDRYHTENDALKKRLEAAGFQVSYANSGADRVMTVRFGGQK